VLFSPPPEPPPSDPALVAPTLYRVSLPGRPGVVRAWLSVTRHWTWDVEGPWWRRRRVRPYIYREWAVDWSQDEGTADLFPDELMDREHDCGVSFYGPDLVEVDRGQFFFGDVAFTLEPVDPHDEPDVWRARWDSCAG
jgi:hypothetical protein